MKLFPEDPVFVIGEVGFDTKDASGRPYDVLGRKPLGQKLTDLVERINQPLVIALDGGWGCGKSYFLKLWTGAHKLELGGKAEVIYFDAFEHDYLDDPLVSLVSALTDEQAHKAWSKTAIDKVKKAAFPLIRLGLRLGAAAATMGATEVVGPVADAVVEKISEATDKTINQFWKEEAGRIAAMKAFREAMEELTKPTEVGGAPRKVVFIVDELDRCRPDYALTLLEIIKHFFAVPNVHFILGANLFALQNSVKARYGEGIDARLYLQKFIHITMSFPQQRDYEGNRVWAAYFDYITRAMEIPEPPARSMKRSLRVYDRANDISLRDVQRIVTRLALLPADAENYPHNYLEVSMSALLMFIMMPQKYSLLRANRAVLDDVMDLLSLRSASVPIALDGPCNDLYHLWRRVLLDDPGEETLEQTSQDFNSFGRKDGKPDLQRYWRDIFDTFHLPDDPASA